MEEEGRKKKRGWLAGAIPHSVEFAMSLHTKRGEAARRREALQCIWQLELNTNNDEEIIKEAANVRKAMFFRSLSLQMF